MTAHDNRPASQSSHAVSSRGTGGSQRSAFPSFHELRSDRPQQHSAGRSAPTRPVPGDCGAGDGGGDGGAMYKCNPAEYPSLREAASAVSKKSAPSTGKTSDGGAADDLITPRSGMLRQLQDRTKNNVLAPLTSHGGPRVCHWCRSSQHSSDQCRDKASNYFLN